MKSRYHRYEDRRPYRAGSGKRVCLPTQADGVDWAGAPLRGLTTGPADGQFVHENQNESLQKSIKMKGDPEDLLKTKGEKSDKMSHADELLKINSLTKTPMSY